MLEKQYNFYAGELVNIATALIILIIPSDVFGENAFLGPQTQDIKDKDLLASPQKVVIVRSWHMMTSCSSPSYLIFEILATPVALHSTPSVNLMVAQ